MTTQFAQQMDESTFLIARTQGSISVPQLKLLSYPGPKRLAFAPDDRVPGKAGGGALQNQLAHFCAVARGEVEPIVSVADAGRSQAAVESAHEAARTQRAAAPGLAGLVISKAPAA